MDRLGRMRRFLAMGMLAAVLLSGCGSTGGDPSASSIQLTEEETEEETMAQQLQRQIMAVLNVNLPKDKRMTSDAALEQAAEFFLDYLIQNPDLQLDQMTTVLNGMLNVNINIAFVYDGKLSAAEVGKKILEDLKELDQKKYSYPESIAIVHGGDGENSVWLLLVHYSLDEVGTGEGDDESDDSEDQEEDSGSSQTTGLDDSGTELDA